MAQKEIHDNASALIERALCHSKGSADFINLKIEEIRPGELSYVEALPFTTRDVKTAEEGRAVILELLDKLGIKNGREILSRFSETYDMRGAMLLNADTLERMEPDTERGIRATYMDAEHSPERSVCNDKNHFQEAIVLASKVISAPHIIAEICMSDDPDYVTGYVAAEAIGYVRITKLKEKGCTDGGRIFLFRGSSEDAKETIKYLEKQKVLVKNAPLSPCSQKVSDPWEAIRKDISQRKAANLYRTTRVIDTAQTAHVRSDGKHLLLLASNSYLGLSDEPRVKEAAIEAVREYGVGSGGSRLTTGTLPLHEKLERDLAAFKGTEAAILFNTGYMANVGILSALGKSGAVIFSDELNHASIIDGCRLGHARTVVYKHNDMKDLEEKLKAVSAPFGVIVSDAVFSMDGDVANLPEIIGLSKKYNLLSMVDEAHATGVIGETGHGIVEYYGNNTHPDILMGTMSKSLASEGGFVCGDNLLIDYLRNTARSFIFSTSLGPAALAAADEALHIIEDEPERVAQLQRNTKVFIKALAENGITTESSSAIVPIIIGDEGAALKAAQALYDDGIFLTAIRYPTVARGTARLRAAIMATHTEAELTAAAQKIAKAVKQ
ncbi:MAG: 8-amino-7-oxononanoate synthase [Schwartzia succinivorans]|nr:8-amino-7-oxononanoate synthase [Schwartzia succinivorans]